MTQAFPNPGERIANNNGYANYRNIRPSIDSATSSGEREIMQPSYHRDSQILGEISRLMRQSLNVENILETAVIEIRRALKVDRVLVYYFNADWSGTIVAESVAPGWPPALKHQIYDPCFREHYVEQYQSGRVQATNNIYEAGLTDCYIKTLEQFAVKANLVTPVIRNNQLLGLLIAHQCSGPREWQIADIDLLAQIATQVGFALEQASLLEERQTAAKRAQLLRDITQLIRRSLKLSDILNTTVSEVRQALKADRVLVYCFNADWSGTIVAESVTAGWPQALKHQIDDPCFREHYVEQYQSGRVHATNDIYNAGLTDCYIKTLEQFAVKANLVAPVLSDNQLLGLLIAHQCSGPREWQIADIDLLAQIATQVGFALDKAALLENREAEAKRVQMLRDITLLIRQSLKLKDILNTTVGEVRQALKADRVLVYCFNADWSGVVTTESVAPGWPSALMQHLDDPCFRELYAQLYLNGRVRAIGNIYKAGLAACHISNLERFAVKANLIAPIVKNSMLFGLLIAQQCSGPREWQKPEIDLFAEIATQVGFALEQADLLEKMEQIAQIVTQGGEALNQAALPEKMEQTRTKVEILVEDKDHDAAITFAGLSWQ